MENNVLEKEVHLVNNNIKSVRYILLRFTSLNEVLMGLITDKDLINPDVYIRIGESKVPLHVIRIIYKDDSIILQNKSYKDVLM